MNTLHRHIALSRLRTQQFDVLVIGGGITGAGIALDAAARGLSVALVEKGDFASGTSSRSTKLIHGGLRYLKQWEFGLVAEVGRERAILHSLAPHLVVPEKMLLPIVKGGSYGRFSTSIGLKIYDSLAKVAPEDRRQMLKRDAAAKAEPLLDATRLRGAGLYAEYRTDDARLTLEVFKTAERYGALPINYLRVQEFIYEKREVVGVVCEDLQPTTQYAFINSEVRIRAKVVVNAAGPWVDTLRESDKSKTGKHLHLTKGVHIVVPFERLPVRQSVYFDVKDGRMVFAIPRGKATYIGTTDTDYEGDLNDVHASTEDVTYLLDATNSMFPAAGLTAADVQSSWAGLRPLIHESGKPASDLSRRDEIFISASGLISIAGGKLTGYRKMAERITDMVLRRLRKSVSQLPCTTHTIRLSGSDNLPDHSAVLALRETLSSQLAPYGLGSEDAIYLAHLYGTQSAEIVQRMASFRDTPVLALLKAEVAFCIEHEMTATSEDFFARRTGLLYFDIQRVEAHGYAIIQEMGRILAWDDARKKQEIAQLSAAIARAKCQPIPAA